jgi:TonB family protein
VLHALVLYAALTTHWHYTIFSYREKPREAILVPRDVARFASAKAQPDRGIAARSGPVKETPGAAVAEPGAKPGAAAKEGPNDVAAKAAAPAGPGEPGLFAPAGPLAGAAGPYTAFKLTYPADARISLSKSAGQIEDRYLPPPSHYRTRTDIDFSKYAERSGLLSTLPSDRPGEGPGGAGGGRPGQAGRRARRSSPGGSVGLNVPGVDFAAWGEIVLNKIQRNWALDSGLGTAWKGEVGVSVLVAKNGDLLAVELDAPTKIDFLDQAALRAVRSSGPFPALPAKYAESSLEVYLVFKYGD